MTDRRRDALPWLVFAAAAAFFFAGSLGHDLWMTGEHRYAEVARTMSAPGGDLVLPHLNGAVYPDKPPLLFWTTALFHRVFGFDLALASRMPSILLAGAFVVALTFAIGRRFHGAAAGLAAACALATMDLFARTARSAQMDVFLTAFITASLYAFLRATEEGARRNAWTVAGYLAVGAGILTKGPPAVAIPAAVLIAHLAWTNPRGLLTPRLAWGAALAALPGAVWLWFAHERGGGEYVDQLLRGHAIGHAVGEIDKIEKPYFYLWNVPKSLLPWTLFLPAAIAAVFRRTRPDERARDRFLVAWLVAPWLLFSMFPAKRDLYMLPIFPAAALLVGRLFRDVRESPAAFESPLVKWPARALAACALVAGAGAVLAAALLLAGADGFAASRIDDWPALRAGFSTVSLVAAAALGVVLAVAGWKALRAKDATRVGTSLVVALAATAFLDTAVIAPSRDADQSPRAFLEKVRARIGDAPLERLGDDGGLQYAVNWVLARDEVEETKSARRAAQFLADERPRFVVTDANEMEHAGDVEGAVEVLRVARRREPDLLLLGNSAAGAR